MTQSLPSGWSLRPIKHVATCNDEVLSENTSPEREIAYIDIGNVKHGLGVTAFETTTFSSAPSRARRLVRNGDVIASTVRTYLRAIARIENPKEDVVVSTGFAVLRPGSLLISRFFGYAMQCEHLIDEIVAHSTGVSYPAIAASDLVRLKIPFPEVATQNAISDFLDRETAEADALVAKYERLIELLEEKRVALITQAVTKGLDPSVPMKESGIAWIGGIPEHWEIKPIKHLFRFEKGKNAQRLTSEYIQANPGQYPVYSGQTDNNGVMGLIETFDYDVTEVLFSTTVGAKVMTPLTLRGRFSLSQNCLIGIPKERTTSTDFFYYALHPLFAYHRASIPDHMQPSLRVADIANFSVIVPNSIEQKRIVDYLKNADFNSQAMINKSRRAIELIRERRSALITSTVTGQIDVSTYRSKNQPIEIPG